MLQNVRNFSSSRSDRTAILRLNNNLDISVDLLRVELYSSDKHVFHFIMQRRTTNAKQQHEVQINADKNQHRTKSN